MMLILCTTKRIRPVVVGLKTNNGEKHFWVRVLYVKRIRPYVRLLREGLAMTRLL